MFRNSLFITAMIIAFGLLANIHADTHTAASVSLADVRAAVQTATDGDTVRIPAGTATWTPISGAEEVRIDKRALTILGAGIDQTIIKDGSNTSASLFRFIGQEGKPFRICHMTFSGLDGVNFPGAATVIPIIGTCKNFRIDHIKFINLSMPIYIKGDTYGLIDHCDFQMLRLAGNPGGSISGIWYEGAGTSVYAKPLILGTSEALYVEDNNVYYGPDASNTSGNVPFVPPMDGSRLVARHNTFINTQFEIYRGDGYHRASLSCEIYDNIFKAEGLIQYRPQGFIFFAGGTGVFFNNTVIGTTYSAKVISISYERSCKPWGSFGMCDGLNPLDGNQIPAGQPGAGYPCMDQPGRGADSNGDGVQEAAPIYEWNNTINGQDLDMAVRTDFCAAFPMHVKEGRDFFNDTPMPGYKPYVYPHPLQSASSAISNSQFGSQNANAGDIGMKVLANSLNGSILISLSSSAAPQRAVKIFNLRGQELADLSAAFAGKSQVQWNAEGLKNGVYLVQANVGGQIHMARMLLQK